MIELFRSIKIFDQPQKLHSGGESNVFIDVNEMLSRPPVRQFIIDELYKNADIAYFKTNVRDLAIVGVEFGGAVLAALLAEKSQLPWGVVRKDSSLVISSIIKNVVLVDDVITTGSSVDDAKKILSDSLITVRRVVCVADRREMK